MKSTYIESVSQPTTHTFPALYKSKGSGCIWLFTDYTVGTCVYDPIDGSMVGRHKTQALTVRDTSNWTRLDPNEKVILQND